MSKPEKTRYTSEDQEILNLSWELKRVTDTYNLYLDKLESEFRAKARELAIAGNEAQEKFFKAIADGLGVSAEDYGDGKDWALNTERLAEGSVTLMHISEVKASSQSCQCPICRLQRMLAGVVEPDGAQQENVKQRTH